MEHLYTQALQVARDASHPLLVAHPRPDGDTLGAMLAFGHTLDAIGKTHTRFCVDQPDKQYRFLPGVEQVTSNIAHVHAMKPDAVFVFDAGSLAYAGIDVLVKDLGIKKIVNIDHHATNERFGTLNIVQTSASSTAEVVHQLLHANQMTPTRAGATCLLTGLCTDTSNFSNPATTASALAVGAELLRRGAGFRDVLTHLVKNKSVPTLKLWGIALSRLLYDPETRIASTALFLDDVIAAGAQEETTEGISNFLGAVMNVPIIFVLKEGEGGMVKGSLRTVGNDDVSLIAKQYGGGGHKKAAGFATKGTIVQEARRWTIVS